mmetsp:Transcript_33060/g.105512  ORF Transcript_33060/g.105512 Transcript_33060/m.105512 type:complete len:302 (-) Transcript_33060:1087-1992(-)
MYLVFVVAEGRPRRRSRQGARHESPPGRDHCRGAGCTQQGGISHLHDELETNLRRRNLQLYLPQGSELRLRSPAVPGRGLRRAGDVRPVCDDLEDRTQVAVRRRTGAPPDHENEGRHRRGLAQQDPRDDPRRSDDRNESHDDHVVSDAVPRALGSRDRLRLRQDAPHSARPLRREPRQVRAPDLRRPRGQLDTRPRVAAERGEVVAGGRQQYRPGMYEHRRRRRASRRRRRASRRRLGGEPDRNREDRQRPGVVIVGGDRDTDHRSARCTTTPPRRRQTRGAKDSHPEEAARRSRRRRPPR